MDRRVRTLALFPVLLALLGPLEARAQSQTTSALRGTVTDSRGGAVADATVRVRNSQTGVAWESVTNAQGRFLVLLLQPGGPYTVTVTRIGFSEASREGIQLQVGQTLTVDLEIQSQAVEVEGIDVAVERSAVFNPAQVGPATLLNERTLAAVPILSRDVMELSVLSPLVRTTESGGFSVGGQNDRYNAILVDGLVNQDAFGLTSGGVPGGQAGAKLLPIDAVAQYEILVAPYDARLSGFAGGVMNAVTKTGTNDWRFRAFGVGRHESLMGDLTLPTGPAEASGVDRTLVGFSAGGPIVRDKAHVFLSTELERRRQPPSGYNLGRDLPALVGVGFADMRDFQDVFENLHGVDTGEAASYPLVHDLANVFARVDWQLEGGHRITARNVFAHASNDESPNRGPFEPYELSSNAVLRSSTSNTTSIQLFSELGRRGGNELDFTFQRSTDRTDPASDLPQVEVVLRSPDNSLTATRPVRLGGQFYAQQNDLAQTSARLTNTLTLANERNTWTMGVSGAWYDIRHEYLPGSRGDWVFPSWTDVLFNAPQRFQQTVLLDGQAPAVGFNVVELGGFIQDQIEVGRLTLRLGLRADVPFVLDHPEENSRVLAFFERSTSNVPSGRPLLSPRIGVNWYRGDRLRTQIRGGAGLFTGQLPYVWLANAFHNNGLRSVVRSCYGRWTDDPATGNTAPPFDPTVANPTCLLGAPRETRAVTFFDDGFAYPQYAKLSVAVDQEITEGLSVSLGYIFSHSINQVLLRELNIHPQENALGPLRGYGGTARTHFGTPSDQGFTPIRLLPGYDQVLLATNGGGDRSWSATAEVRGSLTERVSFQAAYAYARSYDRMSLAQVDLLANYGLTPTHGDPNDPPLTPSNFDRPHKLVLALYGTPVPGWNDTEISLLYTGESGLPFSYVYRGDYNGDGYPALGPASDRNNDLIYVPLDPAEVPSSFATTARLANALATDECLQRFQGVIMLRNHCRAPWQNRLDLRLAHTVRTGGTSFRFEADMINVLNLVNDDWGLIRSIGPVSSLLEPFERVPITAELLSDWAGGILPFTDASGRAVTPQPWSTLSPASQWQAQLGVRVTF
jgi:hypothetical protein